MRLELLVSCVNQDVEKLLATMRLQSDAVVVNQCGRDAYEEIAHDGHTARVFHSKEQGVGRSRTKALREASKEFLLFSDEDIVYEEGYEAVVTKAFDSHPEADMLLFNVIAQEGRRTYYNETYHRVTRLNCGRYPAYSIAARTKRLKESGITFSYLFGGGATYSNGEDSLFLMDCVKHGLKLYATTEILGHETPRASTWFFGYTEKFFFDRGVLYPFLYGKLSRLMALRFLLKNRKEMCREISVSKAYSLMKDGIRQGYVEMRKGRAS